METKTRLEVLICSLTFEYVTSIILGELLDIDIKTSNTLGTKSSSLSFKNKVDLIMDIRAMDKEDAKKFLYFMEIRNQFIHNIHVETFTKCFANLDGIDKKLKKLYPVTSNENLTDEQVLRKCFESLFLDINSIIDKLFQKVRDKLYALEKSDGNRLYAELLIRSLKEVEQESPDGKGIIDEIIKRTDEKYNDESKNLKPSTT